jgi:hypothetical protein
MIEPRGDRLRRALVHSAFYLAPESGGCRGSPSKVEKVRTPRDQDIDWGEEAETMSICCNLHFFPVHYPA